MNLSKKKIVIAVAASGIGEETASEVKRLNLDQVLSYQVSMPRKASSTSFVYQQMKRKTKAEKK